MGKKRRTALEIVAPMAVEEPAQAVIVPPVDAPVDASPASTHAPASVETRELEEIEEIEAEPDTGEEDAIAQATADAMRASEEAKRLDEASKAEAVRVAEEATRAADIAKESARIEEARGKPTLLRPAPPPVPTRRPAETPRDQVRSIEDSLAQAEEDRARAESATREINAERQARLEAEERARLAEAGRIAAEERERIEREARDEMQRRMQNAEAALNNPIGRRRPPRQAPATPTGPVEVMVPPPPQERRLFTGWAVLAIVLATLAALMLGALLSYLLRPKGRLYPMTADLLQEVRENYPGSDGTTWAWSWHNNTWPADNGGPGIDCHRLYQNQAPMTEVNGRYYYDVRECLIWLP